MGVNFWVDLKFRVLQNRGHILSRFAHFINSSANERLTLFKDDLCQEKEKGLRKNQPVQFFFCWARFKLLHLF